MRANPFILGLLCISFVGCSKPEASAAPEPAFLPIEQTSIKKATPSKEIRDYVNLVRSQLRQTQRVVRDVRTISETPGFSSGEVSASLQVTQGQVQMVASDIQGLPVAPKGCEPLRDIVKLMAVDLAIVGPKVNGNSAEREEVPEALQRIDVSLAKAQAEADHEAPAS